MNAVTGALSYTGRAIAEELLARGEAVRSLSRRDDLSDPLRARIELAPLRFDNSLDEALRGVITLYNTYWIRFERGGHTFDEAVARTILLFRAAERAGVERIVHVSVSNADRAPDLPYFRGKARIERWLAESGIRHAIVRPTLVFGPEDILVNNVAWIMRRAPVFVAPSGGGRVQPVSVRDTARICVEAGDGVIDAAGPETLTFHELLRLVRGAIRSRTPIVRAPGAVGLTLTQVAGLALRDVVLTPDELVGLQASLLVSGAPPLGRDSFAEWVQQNGGVLGRRYVSELARNFRGYDAAQE